MSDWLKTLLTLVGFGFGVMCAFHALMFKTRNASGALVWIIFCLAVPVIGALCYVTIGDDRILGRRRRRIVIAHERYHRGRNRRKGGRRREELGHPQLHTLTENDVTDGNDMDLLVGGKAGYASMLADIRSAQTSIALQTYILDEDETGAMFRDTLVERAKAGVDVRVLYDSVGAVTASRAFIRSFRDGGVKIFPFLPFHPFKRRWQINLRNHRKIIVVDSHVGYVGSMNLSARHVSFGEGASHDLAIRICGPVLQDLIDIFASDWAFAATEDPLPTPAPQIDHCGKNVVQAVDSGPDHQERGLHKVVVAACYEAQRRITILTPYFIPPLPVLYALETAAARGVRVELVIPEVTDSRIMNMAIPHYLERVIEAGVHVFRKPGPMLHMKLMLVDDDLAIVGSSNMDARSYFLNFEADIVVYAGPILSKLRALADNETEASKAVKLQALADRPIVAKVLTRIGALFTPVL